MALKFDKSKYFKAEQSWNICDKFIICNSSSNLGKLIEVNALHPLKKYSIDCTEFTLKLLIFNSLKEKQSLNIYFIFVTLEVSKLDILIEVNEKQFLNIYSILTTFYVLNFSKFSIVIFSSLENIDSILVTLFVSNSDKSKEDKDEHE